MMKKETALNDSFLDWILHPADNTWGPLEDAEKEGQQPTLPSGDEGASSALLDNSNNSSDLEITTVDEYIASDEGKSNQKGGNIEFSPEHFYYLGESAEQGVWLFRTSGLMGQFFLRNLDQCDNLYQQHLQFLIT
uniref:Uncharacterized protein n=1 Tax=Romanomermis culicivorax TaxID=13658 RepID=A0A915KN71_ROMCU